MFVVAACASRPRVIAALPDSVTALAFNAVLMQNGSGVRVSTYCLGFAEALSAAPYWKYRDPSPTITHQLETGRDVRAYSLCPAHQEGVIGPLIDTTTGRQVMVLTLQDSIQWGHDTLIVWGNYHCGGLCGGGGRVRLWRRGGRWEALFTVEVVS